MERAERAEGYPIGLGEAEKLELMLEIRRRRATLVDCTLAYWRVGGCLVSPMHFAGQGVADWRSLPTTATQHEGSTTCVRGRYAKQSERTVLRAVRRDFALPSSHGLASCQARARRSTQNWFTESAASISDGIRSDGSSSH